MTASYDPAPDGLLIGRGKTPAQPENIALFTMLTLDVLELRFDQERGWCSAKVAEESRSLAREIKRLAGIYVTYPIPTLNYDRAYLICVDNLARIFQQEGRKSITIAEFREAGRQREEEED